MAKRKAKKRDSTAVEIAPEIRSKKRGNVVSDILGSYTGTSQDGGAPEQDADDL